MTTRPRAEAAQAVPDLLLVGNGVDDDTVRLAADRCARAAVPFRAVLNRRRTVDGQTRALVLWNPEIQALSDTLALLDELSRQGAGFGLVPCVHGGRGLAFLQRTLASPDIPDHGRTGVVSPFRGPAGRPSCVAASDAEVAALMRSELDVLFIHGHGNALDIDLGTKAVLCSRAAVGHEAGPGLFHCFQPGAPCFRQIGDHAGAELIDPRALGAAIIVTISCHVLQLGGGPYSSRFGLLPLLLESRVVAALLTTGVTSLTDRLLVLAMSLIHEGRPLAYVARQLNAFHAAGGRVAGPASGYAPFVVIGNPCARLATTAARTPKFVGRRNGTLVVDGGAAPPPGSRGLLLKVPLASTDLDGESIVRLRGPVADAWKRTVVAEGDLGREAHLWLGAAALAGDRRLALEPRATRERLEGNMLEATAARLAIWEPVLDWYREELCQRRSRARVVERLLVDIVHLRRSLFDAAVKLGEGRARPGSFDAALAALRAAGTRLLAIGVDVAIRRGVPDLGEYTTMRLTGAVGDGGPCACGESPLRFQTYAPATGSGAELRRYLCACSDAGQETAGTPVEMAFTDRRARRGDRVRLEMRCRAPVDALLFVQATVAVEPWGERSRIHGPMVELLLEPGRSSTAACELRIPRTLAPGLYAVSLLGVVNGGLWHRKTLFRIED